MEDVIELYLLLLVPPSIRSAAMQTIATIAMMSAYSTKPCPRSSLRRRRGAAMMSNWRQLR